MTLPLTLASYNIHSAVGCDGRFDPQRTLAVLRELDADVIAVQELQHQRFKGRDLLAYLAEEIGYEAVAAPAHVRRHGHYGNAVLSRLPIIDVLRHDLSHGNREPRSALEVTLDRGGSNLKILATHLGLQTVERRHQVQHLLSLLGENDDERTVLMGDLNEWFLWGRPLKWLESHFGDHHAARTFPSRLPLLALDRIWVHPREDLLDLAVHTSPAARLASDHLPVRALLA